MDRTQSQAYIDRTPNLKESGSKKHKKKLLLKLKQNRTPHQVSGQIFFVEKELKTPEQFSFEQITNRISFNDLKPDDINQT